MPFPGVRDEIRKAEGGGGLGKFSTDFTTRGPDCVPVNVIASARCVLVSVGTRSVRATLLTKTRAIKRRLSAPTGGASARFGRIWKFTVASSASPCGVNEPQARLKTTLW